ncbi:glycosyl transferase family 2 [Falsiroseomonas bella]|uniref:Glycosyl transferase family 2 n=1 Tax=Falsiroseomonas bella TaxID=2184016 RepID=A0A317FKM7_9PROT|nr:TIGR04283 family arsenosugar biosynthesis glycosyltransferase [Falsiroseomonas bella]PWS39113.1 glycosyl transferase family 2 [Falsiroseomonas bella]
MPTREPLIKGLSVVIPALNAAATLPGTLAALGTAPDELVVVDGGSVDGTAAVAAEGGARVVRAPRGRGVQIAAGVAAASRPWLLILHADTRLAPGWTEAVRQAMRDPGRARYFRFALDDDTQAARRLERAVAWRCRVLALPYGDQGLLVHRALLDAVGSMRPLPLMEDVDLVRRLGRARLAALDAAAVTSAERWQREGYLRRSARNLACLSLWFLGVPPRIIQRLYSGRRG